ncbi:MAG: four helix bundle protein [Gammaproteobacteria bacterium]|nr:four helix bundle protein [Gammaproteobacteria bacterium]
MTNTTTEAQIQNPTQIADQLADTLWSLTENWNDHAKQVIGLPLMRAIDQIGLQLALTQGRTTIKQHLQHIANARKGLAPMDYYLQRAAKRGLIEPTQIEALRAQMITLAQCLDQHSKGIVQATNKKVAEQKQRQEEKAKAEQKRSSIEFEAESSIAH